MAMESVRGRYDKILEVQRQMFRSQDKFTDEYYGINISLSDTISMDRSISNNLPPACVNMEYDRSILPTVSILFFNC